MLSRRAAERNAVVKTGEEGGEVTSEGPEGLDFTAAGGGMQAA
jgi:hypothetical protein